MVMEAATAITAPVAAPAGQEIIVTGERIPRPIARTASSVVVVTSDDLKALAAPDRVDQLLAAVPNVQFGSQGTGPAIRGQDTTGASRDLAAFLGGNRPRTTLVVDGRAVSYNEFVFGAQPLWDVARVEIFRTPQSTTQGRNSIAGAIFVSTADPIDGVEASGRFIAGEARTRQFSAAVNAPITDDLAARLSVDLRNSRTSSHLSDASRPDVDLNRDETKLLRLKLRATPARLPGAVLSLTATHISTAMPQIEGLRTPFRQRRDPAATYGFFDTRSDSVVGRAALPITSDLQFEAVASAGWSKATRSAPPGFGEASNRGSDTSAEGLLRWRQGGPVQVTAGLASYRQRLDQDIDLSQVLGAGQFRDVQESLGLFGDVTVELSSRLSLSAGLRWQHDMQERSGTLNGVRGLERLDYRGRSDFLLPRVTIAYTLTPQLTAGLLVQRASNPGGTTISLDGPISFVPETLWTGELFARARLDDGRLQLSANLFRTRFRDAQRAVPRLFRSPSGRIVSFADIINVPSAGSAGLEASADWSVHPRLKLSLSGALLDTRLTAAPGQPLGREFQRAPAWSARAAIAWRPLPDLVLSTQARGRGSYFSDDVNTPQLMVGSGWIVDARAGWERGRLQLFGYARNLLNSFLVTSYSNADLATAEDPRELGIGLQMSF
jgi:outer membrane receptor protein involved in Fe transport